MVIRVTIEFETGECDLLRGLPLDDVQSVIRRESKEMGVTVIFVGPAQGVADSAQQAKCATESRGPDQYHGPEHSPRW